MPVASHRIDDPVAPEEWNYPTLGINETGTLVVLFTGENKGTVVYSEGVYSEGHVESMWDMETFTPYYGKVYLENEQ